MYNPTYPKTTTSPPFGFGTSSTSITPFISHANNQQTPVFGSTSFRQIPFCAYENQTNNIGLFSTPVTNQTFGQTTKTYQPFAFGDSNSALNIFGQSQISNKTNLYDSTTYDKTPFAKSLLGSTTTAQTFFGNVSTTQAAQRTHQLYDSTFGPNSTINLFHATCSRSTTLQPAGTITNFNSPTDICTIKKNNTPYSVITRYHCITIFEQYANKSLEELRYEDYLAKRKGLSQGTQLLRDISLSNDGLFKSTSNVSSTNLLGQTVSTVSSPFLFNGTSTTCTGDVVMKPFNITTAPNTKLFPTLTHTPSTSTSTFPFGTINSTTTTSSRLILKNKMSPQTNLLNAQKLVETSTSQPHVTVGLNLNQLQRPQSTAILSCTITKSTTSSFNNPTSSTTIPSTFGNLSGLTTNQPSPQIRSIQPVCTDLMSLVQFYPEPKFLRCLSTADSTHLRATNPELIQKCIKEEQLKLKVTNVKLNHNLSGTMKSDGPCEQLVHNLFEDLNDVDCMDAYHKIPKYRRNPKRLFLSKTKLSSTKRTSYNELSQADESDSTVSSLFNISSLCHNEENTITIDSKIESVTSTSVSPSFKSKSDNLRENTGIICTREDYYTIPGFDELINLKTDDGKVIIDGFTIGRKNYGNVFFPDTFDVANLNIDRDVYIGHKELIIYDDDDVNKPALGVGLNRPAQITLDRCYPRDKITSELITDWQRLKQMNYEAILRAFCKKCGTGFVQYRPETGSWVFLVEHFTRYGTDTVL